MKDGKVGGYLWPPTKVCGLQDDRCVFTFISIINEVFSSHLEFLVEFVCFVTL